MIRRASGSVFPGSGLEGSAAPGLRVHAQDGCRPAWWDRPGVRRSWLRSAPPSLVGGVWVPPTPTGGSPQGFFGIPICP